MHRAMLLVRRDVGAHNEYAQFRVAGEIQRYLEISGGDSFKQRASSHESRRSHRCPAMRVSTAVQADEENIEDVGDYELHSLFQADGPDPSFLRSV